MQQYMDHGTSHDCRSNAKSIIIIIYIKTGVLLEGLGEKWVLKCDLNEEYVCVWRMEKGRLFQVTGPLQEKEWVFSSFFLFSFLERRDLQFTVDRNEEYVCVADGERQIIPSYRTLTGERVFFLNGGIFSLR